MNSLRQLASSAGWAAIVKDVDFIAKRYRAMLAIGGLASALLNSILLGGQVKERAMMKEQTIEQA